MLTTTALTLSVGAPALSKDDPVAQTTASAPAAGTESREGNPTSTQQNTWTRLFQSLLEDNQTSGDTGGNPTGPTRAKGKNSRTAPDSSPSQAAPALTASLAALAAMQSPVAPPPVATSAATTAPYAPAVSSPISRFSTPAATPGAPTDPETESAPATTNTATDSAHADSSASEAPSQSFAALADQDAAAQPSLSNLVPAGAPANRPGGSVSSAHAAAQRSGIAPASPSAANRQTGASQPAPIEAKTVAAPSSGLADSQTASNPIRSSAETKLTAAQITPTANTGKDPARVSPAGVSTLSTASNIEGASLAPPTSNSPFAQEERTSGQVPFGGQGSSPAPQSGLGRSLASRLTVQATSQGGRPLLSTTSSPAGVKAPAGGAAASDRTSASQEKAKADPDTPSNSSSPPSSSPAAQAGSTSSGTTQTTAPDNPAANSVQVSSQAERVSVIRQIASQAASLNASAGGENTVTVQIHPAHWGPVTVSVSMQPAQATDAASAEGNTGVAATLITADPAVRDALQAHAGDLSRALSAAGFQVGKVDVVVQAISSAGAGQGMGGFHQGQSGNGSGFLPNQSGLSAHTNGGGSHPGASQSGAGFSRDEGGRRQSLYSSPNNSLEQDNSAANPAAGSPIPVAKGRVDYRI